MKEGWVCEDFGNCIKLKSGDNLTAKKMVAGSFPVYGGNDIAGYHNQYNLQGDNIIIGRVGAQCGNSRLIREKIWLTDNAFKITDLKYEFDFQFLNYLLNFVGLRDYARQAAQPVISNSSLKKVQLTFPKSIEEQKQIVAILDDAFAAIEQAQANIQKNIDNAKELFQSKLNDIFSQKGEGWEEKAFSELFKLKSGDGLTAKNMIEGEFPVYGGNGISGYHNNYNKNGKYLIIGRVGALCGNVRYLNEKFWLTDNAFEISEMKVDFDYSFLYYLLNSKNLRSYARQAAQPVISNSSLKSVRISYPKSILVQKEYADTFRLLESKIENITSTYESKKIKLEDLKKSLLEQAFAGKLTDKDMPA